MRRFPGGIWCCDFEYQKASDSERPFPICMTARELYSRRELRLFGEELRMLRRPPFEIGEDACMVTYSASAEASCFAVLDWPMPANVLDLYAEHLRDLNGRDGRRRGDAAMLAALERHGLPSMSAIHKEAMRDKIRFEATWSEEVPRRMCARARAASRAFC
jgi:hypothetical protein